MENKYGTFVQLITSTPEAEELIERAGRTCANSVVDMYVGDELKDPNWIQKRVAQGHESILEHGSATFRIFCSRAVTHELVRHRIASYSQRSQRYAKEDGCKFFTPPEFAGDSEYEGLITELYSYYYKKVQGGMKPEIARYVLPNAWRTEIYATMNFRELRHFIKLRASPRALPEMQEVANQVKGICVEVWPRVFGDLK